jgi:hypothetical protein
MLYGLAMDKTKATPADPQLVEKFLGLADDHLALYRALKAEREAGRSRDELMGVLEECSVKLRAAGREQEDDNVLDGMDALVGWVHPDARL